MSDLRSMPSRREVIALGIGAFVVGAVPFTRARYARLVRRTLPVMGTVAEIAVVHADPRWAAGAIDAALDELRRVESTMSRFRADSDVGRVNAAGKGAAVVVGASTARVIDEALRWAAASHGRFEPAFGRATVLWDATTRSAPPAATQARRFAGRDMWRSVERGHSGGDDVVVLRDADAALDLGGIAKGYAVDRAVAALRDWGIASALVNAGGDLYALGASADGEDWSIGVRDPRRADGLLATLRVRDRAVATSGDYERFFTFAGRRYHHLLDPTTGEPRVCAMRSVTIAADTCMSADAAGTALFGSPRAEAERLLAAAAPDAEILHTA